jgi:hypothetical protein
MGHYKSHTGESYIGQFRQKLYDGKVNTNIIILGPTFIP